jgi:hypothetical protein
MKRFLKGLWNLYLRGLPFMRRGLMKVGIMALLDRRRKQPFVRYVRGLLASGSMEELIRQDTPWWRYVAIERIEPLLDREKTTVFEYGAGASTVWLAKRCKEVVSVEYDAAFYEELKPQLAPFPNVTLLCCPPVEATPQTPPQYRSGFTRWRNYAFEDFVKTIDRDQKKYDLIVVDGRSRMEAVRRALSHVKPGGLVMLDDAERQRYKKEFGSLEGVNIEMLRGYSPATPLPGQAALITLKKG